MDDVTFCVEKNVPIVPEEGEEEEATVSLASVDLKLQHWPHHNQTAMFLVPLAYKSRSISQDLKLAMKSLKTTKTGV